jgi:hypothetical protein
MKMIRSISYISMVIVLLTAPSGVYASHGHVFTEPEDDVLSPCESYLVDCGDGSIGESDDADNDNTMEKSGVEEIGESPQQEPGEKQ